MGCAVEPPCWAGGCWVPTDMGELALDGEGKDWSAGGAGTWSVIGMGNLNPWVKRRGSSAYRGDRWSPISGRNWMAGVGGDGGGRISGGGRRRMGGTSGGGVSPVSSKLGSKGMGCPGRLGVEWFGGGVDGEGDLGGVEGPLGSCTGWRTPGGFSGRSGRWLKRLAIRGGS